MNGSPNPLAHLAPDAVPAIQEVLRRVVVALPPHLGRPPVDPTPSVEDPVDCVETIHSVLAWLESAPDGLGQRIDELEARFSDVLEEVHALEGRARRLVGAVRDLVDEGEGFTHALAEALETPDERTPDPDLIATVVQRLKANSSRGREESRKVLSQVDRFRADLERIATHLGRAEATARALRTHSLRDPLTGLWNRTALNDRLAEEVSRAERYRTPFALILWDVDRLSAINDHHGRRVGDQVLRTLASRVFRLLRRSDFVGCHGEGTFAVVLPNTPVEAAVVAAEKIRRLAVGAEFSSPEGGVRATVSSGVAGWVPGDCVQTLTARAADALDRARRGGMDRVETQLPPRKEAS